MERVSMTPNEARLALVQHFIDLHQSLGLVRCILLELKDTEALELLDQMGLGLIAPMKRLRDHLNVPYSVKEDGDV